MCLGVTTSCSIKVAAVINVPSLLISPLLPKCLRPFRNRNGSTGSVPAIDTGYFFSEQIVPSREKKESKQDQQGQKTQNLDYVIHGWSILRNVKKLEDFVRILWPSQNI